MASPQTTVTSAKGWSPDIQKFLPGDAVPDALLLNTSTVVGEIQGDEPLVRVPWVDDSSAEFVPEGKEISESEPELAETTVRTGKIAQLLRVSREQMAQNQTPGMLSTSVQRAVVKAADKAYLNQSAPSDDGDPPAGLLNVSGVTDGGTVEDSLDAIADAMSGIESEGGEASVIIAAPNSWGRLRKLKVQEGSNQSLLGVGAEDMQKRLLGIPVLTSHAVPDGKLIVMDSNSVVSAAGAVEVAQSKDVYFSYDSVGLRCVWRFGASVMHPARIATLEVADPAKSE